ILIDGPLVGIAGSGIDCGHLVRSPSIADHGQFRWVKGGVFAFGRGEGLHHQRTQNPLVVCFTSPLPSLIAISSPPLSCFHSPTRNLP
ncbi:MAG: hypothetical protein QF498_01825, partial [Arenicellales bacterium]|nr:hypothetical protein [Arenicellales bacterium]